MSLITCSLLLFIVLAMIGVNARIRYKAELDFEPIDAMHPTLIKAHTIANRNQQAYAVVRNGFGQGVSIVPEGRVGMLVSQKVVAIVRPIPIGDEYNTVPFEFMKPGWKPVCEQPASSANHQDLSDWQPA